MPLQSLRRLAIALLASALAAGCTSTSHVARLELGGQPPITKIPDEDTADLAKCGETATAKSASPRPVRAEDSAAFGGVLRAADEPVGRGKNRFILHIHGMGDTQRCAFTRDLLGHLEKAGYRRLEGDMTWHSAETLETHRLWGEGLDCNGAAAGVRPCLYDRFGEYRIDRYEGPAADRITVYTYYWHRDMWEVQYRYLKEDLQHDRGLIGTLLKNETVDKGLGDAAGYLGPMGEPLRDALGALVCRMVRDAVDAPEALRPLPDCLDSAELARFRNTDVEFNFLSHSLGSRMLFDALEPAVGAGSGEFVSDRTRTFFMAANQLPLLGIGRLDHRTEDRSPPGQPALAPAAAVDRFAGPCGELPIFLADRCVRSESRLYDDPINRLDVVAFVDPGDLLGFRANGSVQDNHYGDVRFLNVIHRNTPEIAFLGSWPLSAHDRELQTPSATRLILCGAVKVGKDRLEPRQCAANP